MYRASAGARSVTAKWPLSGSDVLGLTQIARDYLQKSASGGNIRRHLVPLLRRPIYSCLAGSSPVCRPMRTGAGLHLSPKSWRPTPSKLPNFPGCFGSKRANPFPSNKSHLRVMHPFRQSGYTSYDPLEAGATGTEWTSWGQYLLSMCGDEVEHGKRDSHETTPYRN